MRSKREKIIFILLVVVALFSIGYGIFTYINKNPDEIKDADNALKESDKKLEISESMTSFILSYRLSGLYGEKRFNDNVRIENYMNKQYTITETLIDVDMNTTMKTTYVVNGKTYKQNDDFKYVKTEDNALYTDPNIYSKPLSNAIDITEGVKETIGNKEYTKYNFTTDKELMKQLMAYTSIGLVEFNKNILGTVWLDEENQIYRLEYNLGNSLDQAKPLNLILFYFGLNNGKDLHIEEMLETQ